MIGSGRPAKGTREARVKTIARNVVRNMIEGKSPSIQKEMEKVGYARSVVDSRSGDISGDPIFQKELMKFEDKLQRVIDISFDIIENKKDEATFSHGVDAMDKMTKLKRLIDGKSTENHAHMIANVLDELETDTTKQYSDTTDTTCQEETELK